MCDATDSNVMTTYSKVNGADEHRNTNADNFVMASLLHLKTVKSSAAPPLNSRYRAWILLILKYTILLWCQISEKGACASVNRG